MSPVGRPGRDVGSLGQGLERMRGGEPGHGRKWARGWVSVETSDWTRMTPEQIAELRKKKYNATVLRQTRVHADLMILRVRPDFPRPPHRPGQYTSLGLGYSEPRHTGC